jgi:hypothetical protein
MESLRSAFWPKSKKGLGSPIYVEEDGPILGVVDDILVDRGSGKPLAYRIQSSGQYVELPAESITETPGGFVYRSPWFTEADALIRKLESHELLMPEMLFSTESTSATDKKLLEGAMEKSPELKKLVEEAKEIHAGLIPRLDTMEKERVKVIGQVSELSEGLATGRLDKGTYREGFVALKRRLQLLEATLRRGEALKTRLETSPIVRMVLNGSASASSAEKAEGAMTFAHAPTQRPEEWRRIKKFRVLKTEKELEAKEARLKVLESQIRQMGLPVDATVGLLASDFDALIRAHEKGPDALKQEIEKRLQALAPPAPQAPTPSPVIYAASAPVTRCPFCAEPLSGNEATCPGCHANLKSVEPAGKGKEQPGKVDKFMKDGGATKTGVVFLLAAVVIFVLYWIVH